MWELDHKEGWVLKKWCFWTVVLEKKTLEGHLNSKEIKPVNPKGNQSGIFIGRTASEPDTLILWPPDAKNWLIWKDPDSGKDWGQEMKGMTENKIFVWHHWLHKMKWSKSHSLVSDSLWPHGLQHARPPCPSPSLGACSNSRPLSWWCHPTILSSVIPFSSCLQLSQHQSFF